MKIIAITETFEYDRSPKRLLVDISSEELGLLSGTKIDRYEIKIGTQINVRKLWDDMYTLRQFINQKKSVINQMRAYCDKLEAIEVPKLVDEN